MTARLYVIAPLSLADGDRAWIEAIRAEHDPQHGLVAAHVTFVFGVAGDGLAGHVEAIAARTWPIAVLLERAVAVREAARSLVFLLPALGEAEMRRLHAALYGGPLAADLRLDIPYHPHVTIAAFADHGDAERLAGRLTKQGVAIAGSLDQLQIAAFDGKTLEARGTYPLNPSAAPDQ